MHVITYRGKPATLEKLYSVEDSVIYDHNLDDSYLVGKTKAATISLYIHHFGFTWKERPEGIDCLKVSVGG